MGRMKKKMEKHSQMKEGGRTRLAVATVCGHRASRTEERFFLFFSFLFGWWGGGGIKFGLSLCGSFEFSILFKE